MFELNITPEWYDSIFKRTSVRQYQSNPTEAQLNELGKLCRKISWQGVTVRMFEGPGLKSQIKGTNVYAVIVAKNGTDPELEGFMGEALVLEAVRLGLSTCWLGAGFNPDIVSKNVNLGNDESIHCVIALGQAGPQKFNPKRRTIQQLCDLSEDEIRKLGPWQYDAVNAARMAPSAINQQPWTFKVDETSLCILERHVLIGKYAEIDRGICMLHAATAAVHNGRSPLWKKGEDGYQMRA